jgi:hypothetical protein
MAAAVCVLLHCQVPTCSRLQGLQELPTTELANKQVTLLTARTLPALLFLDVWHVLLMLCLCDSVQHACTACVSGPKTSDSAEDVRCSCSVSSHRGVQHLWYLYDASATWQWCLAFLTGGIESSTCCGVSVTGTQHLRGDDNGRMRAVHAKLAGGTDLGRLRPPQGLLPALLCNARSAQHCVLPGHTWMTHS